MNRAHRASVLSLWASLAFFISFAAHDYAWSADYPTKPIEMVVPFGAGGAADIAARILATGAEKTLGKPIAVINRTGGGGAIGYSAVKNARPDGYTLMWNSTALLTLAHARNIDFDYRAFEAVCLISTETPTFAVKKDAPWKDLRELIEHARKNPRKVESAIRASAAPLTSLPRHWMRWQPRP